MSATDQAMERDPGDPIEERMPLARAIPLGLQHVLAMFVGNITVPIIIAGVIGADAAERAFVSPAPNPWRRGPQFCLR